MKRPESIITGRNAAIVMLWILTVCGTKADPSPLHAVWTSAYTRADSSETQVIQMQSEPEGVVYLWCQTEPLSGGKESTLVKMDNTGQIYWEVHLSHSSASNAFPVDSWLEEDHLLVCSSLDLTNSQTGILTASISKNGHTNWLHVYSNGTGVAANSICEDSTGGVAVAGIENENALVIKLDGNGQQQWTFTNDGPWGGENQWLHVRPALTGEVYTLGQTRHPGAGTFTHIALHASTGSMHWSSAILGPAPGALVTDSQGNAFIGDAGVAKFDATGLHHWTVSTTGGPPFMMQLTQDEQYIFIAGDLRVSGKFRYHIAKLSVTGALDWAEVIRNDINPSESWRAYSAAVDSNLFSYVSGSRGTFLISPAGDQLLNIPGQYRHMSAVGHNQLFTIRDPATIEYLSGFPLFSEDTFRFYGAEARPAFNDIRTWVPSINGQVLHIEYTDNLLTPDWNLLSPLTSSGIITEVIFSSTNETASYRIRTN